MAQAYISKRNRLPSTGYKVRFYRYGEVWKVVTVEKDKYVTFPTCDVAYADDTFYGWSTDPNSTNIKYATGERFYPTSDMDVYAVFRYTQNSTIQQSKSVSATLDQDQTIEITDATVGTTYKITRMNPTSVSQGKRTATGSYNGQPSTYTVYYPDISTTTTVVESGTTTSSNITYSASKGTSVSAKVLVGASNWESSPSYNTVTIWSSITIDYYTTISQTGVKYRVVSHDNDSVINVYSYGELVKTVSIKEGLSTTLGEISSSYSDDTFYGYSTSPSSTKLIHSATTSITPHGELNLYAIYSYLGSETEYLITSSSSSSAKTITVNAEGTCRVSGLYTVVRVSNGSATVESTSSSITLGSNGTSVKKNNQSVSGTTPIEVAAVTGDVFAICGNNNSTVNSSGNGYSYTYEIQLRYPNHPTKYRVSAHI